MSAVGLGASAHVGELIASQLSTTVTRDLFKPVQAAAGAIPSSGTYFLNPVANPTAFTLADGVAEGDRVLIIHRGGANLGVITPATLASSSTTISMLGGQSIELIWGGDTYGWYVTGRAAVAAQATNAVAVAAIA